MVFGPQHFNPLPCSSLSRRSIVGVRPTHRQNHRLQFQPPRRRWHSYPPPARDCAPYNSQRQRDVSHPRDLVSVSNLYYLGGLSPPSAETQACIAQETLWAG